METINASEFKARCPEILDRVQATGERIVVVRHGRPVAELGPTAHSAAAYSQMELKGTITIMGDIIAPADYDWLDIEFRRTALPEDHWDGNDRVAPTPLETRKSLIRRFLENLGWCYVAFAVFGFPWIVVESWPLAVALLVPLLVWLWRDSKPAAPEIRF